MAEGKIKVEVDTDSQEEVKRDSQNGNTDDNLIAQLEMLKPDELKRLLIKLGASENDQKELDSTVGYNPREEERTRSRRYVPEIGDVPKLPPFSGLKDKDTSFGRWRFEVKALRRIVPDHIAVRAIYRSLKSPAADAVLYEEDADVTQILMKLEALYGLVISGDALMTKVYSEPQKSEEDCTQWATRLENLCYQAVEKEAIGRSSVMKMITSRFWAGLRNVNIKNALREQKNVLTMNELVSRARELEEEFSVQTESKKQESRSHQQQTPNEPHIRQLMKKMDTVMTLISRNATSSKQATQPNSQQNTQPNSQQNTHPNSQQNTQSNTQQKPSIRCHKCHDEGHLSFGCRQGTEITCYRCKKKGHISRACRIHLN